MPNYEVSGRSVQTNRKRKLVVSADSEVEAKIKAERSGLVEITLIQLPEPLATDRQISYAQALGIKIPEGATLEQLSNLISAKVDNDKPSEEHHRRIALSFGIEVTSYIGKKALFNRIMSELSAPDRERDLVAWFAYRVSRTLFKGRKDAPIQSPDHPAILEIAKQLSVDPSLIKSIRRYTGESLIWFGEFTASDGTIYNGGSVATTAYKEVSRLLKEKLGIESEKKVRAPPSSSLSSTRAQKAKSAGKGCFSVVIMGVSVSSVLFYLLAHCVGRT